MTERSERRRTRRRQSVDEHGIVRARVRPGYEVVLVDVSAGGALVETARRLFPGSLIELQLSSAARSASVRGRVIRCTVSRVKAASVRYRGAIRFDRELSWFHDHNIAGYSVPAAEMRASASGGADTTPTPH
jgi:hypothetical protein